MADTARLDEAAENEAKNYRGKYRKPDRNTWRPAQPGNGLVESASDLCHVLKRQARLIAWLSLDPPG